MRDLHALVVDDSEINQLLICKILETEGFSSEVAFDGRESVEMLENKVFDLVFMDIQMPELDGYQATELIRKLENGKNVPIIAVTAQAMPEDEEKCLQAGMDHYITKPVQPKDIIALVRAIFGEELDERIITGDEKTNHVQTLFQKVHSDLVFLQKLTTKFEASYNELIPKIKLAIQEEKIQDIKTHAHTLKGLLGALEAVEAVEIMNHIEKDLQDKSVKNMLTLLNKLESTVNQVIIDINAFIETEADSD